MIAPNSNARRWLAEMALVRPISPSTEAAHGYALNAFEAFHGGPATLQDLAARLSDFVRYRTEKGYAPHGIRTQRGALLTLLRFAEDAGAVEVPRRVRNVRLVDLEPTWFSDDELRQLLAKADGYQAAAIWLARRGAAGARKRWRQTG